MKNDKVLKSNKIHWNLRVLKEDVKSGEDWFSVREVFYDTNDNITGYTIEPINISGGSVEGLKEYCQWILEGLDKPILEEGKVKYVDFD